MPAIDRYSLVTVPLELFFNDTRLGWATAFVWREENKNYLVTNWHVLSGYDFFTKKLIRGDGGRPNILRALFTVVTGSFDKRRWDISIRDENDEPLWLVYPGAKRVDIAVLPLPAWTHPITIYPINELATDELLVEVGMDVFILGYPFEIMPPALPVWKRGSIASEPGIVHITTDYMLVDTASRPGMSGSPVIRRCWQSPIFSPSGTTRNTGSMNRFVGVYSGRMPTDHPYEAQIGLVWDGSLIRNIIAGGIKDAQGTTRFW